MRNYTEAGFDKWVARHHKRFWAQREAAQKNLREAEERIKEAETKKASSRK